MRRYLFLLWVVFGLGLPPAHAAPLVFSVHPFANPATVHRAFQPLVDYLARKTGAEIVLQVAPNYLAHVQSLGSGKAALGYVGPSPYVRVADKYGGVELLARLRLEDEINDQVVLFCRDDAELATLADLAGQSFAFGDHQSFGSHYMARWLLHRQGIELADLAAYDFVRSHDNVILSVLHGDFAAGCVRLDVFRRYVRRPLRVLAGPFAIPPHAIVCRRDLPADLRQRLRRALIECRDPRVLGAIDPAMTGFAPVADREFELARRVMRFVEGR